MGSSYAKYRFSISRHHLVYMCTHQSWLIESEWNNKGKFCSSHTSVFISLADFLNSLHFGLKYPIRFFMSDTFQNCLRLFNVIIVNYLNIFKFLFYCEKVNIVRSQIRWIRQVRYTNHVVRTEQLSAWVTNHVWCRALSRKKIAYSSQFNT
jgi:hypothetical protein